MKIVKLEAIPVRVPYQHDEVSSIIARGGVSSVIVKLTTDDGLVGWGESCTAADTAGIESAIRAMTPFVIGSDPWQTEAIARDVFVTGAWQFQPMTGNFACAGIDTALWDLCGKACGQPLYRLFGGALHAEIDYVYFLRQASAEEVAAQGRDGVERGYTAYYLKVGVDGKAEEAMLEAPRQAIGSEAKIRIVVNQAWPLPEAARILADWHERFDIDFVEAPVPIDPLDNMLGLRRFNSLIHLAHLEGQLVCKHAHGELGLTAAAGQHMMLCAPNACEGHQQTAQMMTDDILTERLPIADGPKWGRIEGPGLGVDVDADKLATYHEAYRRDGEFVPYGSLT